MREKHGMTETKIYQVWKKMRHRCLSQGDKDFPFYGGRGITVCERWNSFKNFLADMGYPPVGATIERLDNDGPYSRENCKWSNRVEQNRNRRNNHLVTFDGRTMCIAAWADEIEIKPNTLLSRLRHGWTISRALGTP